MIESTKGWEDNGGRHGGGEVWCLWHSLSCHLRVFPFIHSTSKERSPQLLASQLTRMCMCMLVEA